MGYILAAVAIAQSAILLRKKVNIGFVMLINAAIIALGTKMSSQNALHALRLGTISSKTIGILVILTLILMIEHIMRKNNMIANLVLSIKNLMGGSPYSAVILPIVIGMLPSPGGARFSCPMVEETVKDALPNERKAFINYWFRHTWLEAFILYPAVILLSELVGVSVLTMFVRILPFMVLWIVLGLISAYHNVDKSKLVNDNKEKVAAKANWKLLFKSAYPIITIVGIYLLLITLTNVPFALQISGIITVIMLLITKRNNFKKSLHTLKKSISLKYIITIVGVMIFNEFIKSSGLIETWIQYIYQNNIPIQLLYVILPIIAALFAGIAVNYVSLAFPILILAGISTDLWDVTAAFICGVVGTMCTPIHLCSVMSADYFKVPVQKLLWRVFLTAVPVLIISIIVIIL